MSDSVTPEPGAADRRPSAPRRTGFRASARPYVTWTIIAVTFACFLLQFVPALELQQRFAFAPVLAHEQPWRALTAALVHAQPNPGHVFFNMLGVFFFGTFIERAVGHAFTAVVYVLSAFGGSVLTLLLAAPETGDWSSAYVGASGAVFGLIGVLLTPTRRLDRNIGGVVLFIVLNIGYMAIEPNIAWQAHLGGLITGFLLGCARLLPPRHSGPRLFWIAAPTLAVVLVILYALL